MGRDKGYVGGRDMGYVRGELAMATAVVLEASTSLQLDMYDLTVSALCSES